MAAAPPPGSVIVLDDEDEGPPPAPPTPPGPSGTPPGPPPATPSHGEPPGTPPSGGGGKDGGYKEENERLFGEFLALCTPLTAEHPEVLPFLCSRHQKAGAGFRASAELRNVLSRCLRRVRRRRAKVYVYINELCTTLKAHSLRRKLPLSSAPTAPAQPQPQPAPEPSASPSPASASPTGSKRQIRYLENLLRVYTGEIRRLQERELDLSELDSEDSAYLQESRLKRRMMRIFQRLCELKRCSSLTGRVMEQRIPYRGTRYPEVNRRIERFINRPEVFPDYSDILKVIQKANGRHRLGLARKHMESMAQDAFREVGNRLQERRHLDLVYNFGSHLTDQYRPGTDPALMDPELAKRLRRNRTMALSRLDQVISHYAQLQDESEEEERGRKRRRGTPGKSQPREEEEEEETEEETEEEEEEEEEGDSSDGSRAKGEEEDEGDPMELNAPHGRDEDAEGTTSKLSIPYGRAKGDPMELNVPHGRDEDAEGTTSKLSIPYGRAKGDEGDPMELNAPHGRRDEEDDEGTTSKLSVPYGSPKGDPMELNAPHGRRHEDDEGTSSKLSIPYGSPKGDPMELNAPHGREDEEEDEGTTSKLSIPYGSPKGDEGPHVPYGKDAGDAPHGQAKPEPPITPAPGAIPMEVMPKTPEELFMVEIETLPMEANETPPSSPHPMGGSEAKPKGVSPPHSQSPSLSRPIQDHWRREWGGGGGPPTFRVPFCLYPAGKRGFPLENGGGDGGGGATISSTSCNGSAEEGGDPPGPPHKRSRRELPGGGSPYIEVHSVGSEDEDDEEGGGGGGGGTAAGGGSRHSPVPDSTRADSPGGDLVSSSQGSPRQRHPKACKMSVATQCDPEEIIVLSDSD